MERQIEVRLKYLYELRKELLFHVVGMDYRMQQVKEINKEIMKLEKEKKA